METRSGLAEFPPSVSLGLHGGEQRMHTGAAATHTCRPCPRGAQCPPSAVRPAWWRVGSMDRRTDARCIGRWRVFSSPPVKPSSGYVARNKETDGWSNFFIPLFRGWDSDTFFS